ncbi:MAG: site-specific integrase [Deltaproteobacteria bacterium]|nr:site-specific integrase [Deltaproteobacteria bacterium]
MSVYRRGRVYYVDVRDGRGRRIRRKVSPSLSVTQTVEKDLQVGIAKSRYLGVFTESQSPFAKYAAAWLERRKAVIAPSTWRDYRSILDVYAVPCLGLIPLAQIRHRDMERFLETLRELSGKRRNNVMVPVKAMFRDAVRRGDLMDSPCAHVRRCREDRPEIDPMSFGEVGLFLEHVDPWYRQYFAAAFLTGMRPSEMLALKWRHVDFATRTISIREGRVGGVDGSLKTTSSNRDIDMLSPLTAVLRRHREASGGGDGYVFTGKGGLPLDVANLRNRVWYPALRKAGLRRRTMYQTRHTFASLMLAHGEDPLWVARMLGHATMEMIFRHYGKFIRNRARRDGGKFLAGLEEAKVDVVAALPPGEGTSVTGEIADARVAQACLPAARRDR